MALDEFTAVMRARIFVKKVSPATIPVSIEAYAKAAGAAISVEMDLEPGESGWSFSGKGKHFIGVNGNERLQRQRFTSCHEIGHIVLGLPSEHQTGSWWSYNKRPFAEVLCDIFAAELLLPFGLFQPLAEDAAVEMRSVESLAERFGASLSATGSRFAAVISTPCAFVLSEGGKVRYAARSKALVDANAWIQARSDVPTGSVSERSRSGQTLGREEIDADMWFSNWERGGVLLEEARYLADWDQTLTLLWFESGEVPRIPREKIRRWDPDGPERREDEDELLQELDGNLRWPSKNRRR